jgi:cell shape-determining protein MreC
MKKITIFVCVICAFTCIGIIGNFEAIPTIKVIQFLVVSYLGGASMNFFFFVQSRDELQIEKNKTDYYLQQHKSSMKDNDMKDKEIEKLNNEITRLKKLMDI